MDIHLISILAGKQMAESVQQTLKQPDFIDLIHRFLYAQCHPESNIEHISLDDLPAFHEKVTLYPSAIATFYAPSNISGTGGMRCEYIHATSDWGKMSPPLCEKHDELDSAQEVCCKEQLVTTS